jgi:hypothetical protein
MDYDLTQLLATSYYTDKNLYNVKSRQILIIKSYELRQQKTHICTEKHALK